jgi:hypothetical protein
VTICVASRACAASAGSNAVTSPTSRASRVYRQAAEASRGGLGQRRQHALQQVGAEMMGRHHLLDDAGRYSGGCYGHARDLQWATRAKSQWHIH